jgi:hypothetical protein
MAKKEKTTQPANAMDYKEHDKTYDVFIKFSLWTTAACVAILIAMAFGFFAGGGLIGGTLLFLILMVACWFAL